MKTEAIRYTVGVASAILFIVVASLFYAIHSSAVSERVAGITSETLTDQLGTETEIGAVEIDSLHSVTIHDIAIYDKQAECIVKAPTAEVRLRLLSALQDASAASAIDTIHVDGAEATLVRRDDGTWNVEDIAPKSSEGKGFSGKVEIENARAVVRAYGNELLFNEIAGTVDCGDTPTYTGEISATSDRDGAALHATATISSERQIVNADVTGLDAAKYVALLPDGVLPENVHPIGGVVKSANATLYRRADVGDISLIGEGEVDGGAVDAYGLAIRDVTGFTHFTNRDITADLAATVEGQAAQVHGNIRFDTASPAMNIEAKAEGFDPAPVLQAIANANPSAVSAIEAAAYAGAADFTATVGGTFANPTVDGDFHVASGSAAGVAFQNAGLHARLMDNVVYIQNLAADVFGGKVAGEGEFALADQSYAAHLTADGIDVAAVQSYAGTRTSSLDSLAALAGRAKADVTFSGTGADADTFQAGGSMAVAQGAYGALPIDTLSASFGVQGRDLTIDYLSAQLPNRSSVGLEGKIVRGEMLDLAFYGGHFDLSLLADLDSRIDMQGFSDFKGTVHGSLVNPEVAVDFSANHGKAFHQPFDSLVLKASGSLDHIAIDDFLMENGGRETWIVTGFVGLAGEKNLDVRVDCMGARMEDIAALVAPEQPITGNVDNTIHFTGTLDHPEAVGYIHFYRGSYAGVLLSGMDGDYFIQDDVLRLQVFHIYSPMVDAVLNGTIGLDQTLNLDIDVRDIDMKRIEHKLPYEVLGHGTFEGHVTGTIPAPVFDGTLDAKTLTLNGVDIPRAYGHAHYENDVVTLDRFGFLQGDGSYDLDLAANLATHGLTGNVLVTDADLTNLCALVNQKNDVVKGTLNASAILDGTMEDPYVDLQGTMTKGTIAGYDVHDVAAAAVLENRVLRFDQCIGYQGTDGVFELTGTAALDGTLDLGLTAHDITLGMFAKAAGIGKDIDVLGTADIDATLTGNVRSPEGHITLAAKNGGIQGSTFDTLTGEATLSHGILDVKNLVVQKAVANGKDAQTYQASAKGIVPLRALTAGADDELADFEQIHLDVSLDHADLSLLPVLSNQVEWAVGETRGSVLVTGTAAHPLFSGELSLPDGAVKLRLIQTPIESLHVKASFHGNEMTLDELSGKMGNGSFTGGGDVTLAGLRPVDYAADLSMNHLDVVSTAYTGPLTGEFHVTPGEIFGHELPKLAGKLTFDNCEISIPMIPDSDGELPDILLDVDVTAGDKVHFYSSALYDMYITGAAHFGGTTRHPQPTGEFHVKRGGTVTYLKNVFQIYEGTATFDQVDTFLPSIRFLAATKVGSTRIFFGLDGALANHMDVKLTSSPEYSETEILRMLTLQSSYRAGSTSFDADDLLTLGLQMTVLGQLEDQMKSILWLDTFRIARGSGSMLDQSSRSSGTEDDVRDETENVYNVEMGKRISDKFQMHYVRGIGDNTNRYGVTYDLSDNIGLMLDHESGDTLVGIEARYKF